ncbi:MAG: hypothetical protein NPIRA01_25920 [Nitrospirales bacterium]|nr:MAG: hypothetical protein NPIRA01_25920 [Nitrospirales bacterium]
MGKYFSWFLMIGTMVFLVGCSSQESRHESQSSLDSLLCWLRPSCLPSQSSSTPPPSPAPQKKFPKDRPSPQQVAKPKVPPPPPCVTTVKTTITNQKPSITISYVEPDTQVDGTPLHNLAKTTIYHNQGKGFIKTKDVPATNPKGGGTITETLSIDVGPRKEVEATICVTATNQSGKEG